MVSMVTMPHKTTIMEVCLKCGVRVEPPTLIVIYKTKDKFRKKTMPLRQFRNDSNCALLAQQIKSRHNLELPTLKIEKMLRLIQEFMKEPQNKEKVIKIVEDQYTTKSNGNLNKLPTEQLELHKQEMEFLFSKNQIKKDNPEFVYDKEVEFEQLKEPSAWDNDGSDEVDFWK